MEIPKSVLENSKQGAPMGIHWDVKPAKTNVNSAIDAAGAKCASYCKELAPPCMNTCAPAVATYIVKPVVQLTVGDNFVGKCITDNCTGKMVADVATPLAQVGTDIIVGCSTTVLKQISNTFLDTSASCVNRTITQY